MTLISLVLLSLFLIFFFFFNCPSNTHSLHRLIYTITTNTHTSNHTYTLRLQLPHSYSHHSHFLSHTFSLSERLRSCLQENEANGTMKLSVLSCLGDAYDTDGLVKTYSFDVYMTKYPGEELSEFENFQRRFFAV